MAGDAAGEPGEIDKPVALFGGCDTSDFEECAAVTGLWVWCIEDFGLGENPPFFERRYP